MPVFNGVVNDNNVKLNQTMLNNNAELTKEIKDEIIQELLDLVEVEEQFMVGYKGYSSFSFQTAMEVFYSKCSRTTSIQEYYGQQLIDLGIAGEKINLEAENAAGGIGLQ